MSRQIKFRGRIAQGLENAGHWVYWGLSGTDMLDALDPDTIGQYTGRLDKNSKEIYEEDIILWPWSTGDFSKAIIEYQIPDWGAPGFIALTGKGDVNSDRIQFDERCEVIGNIHENSEMVPA